MTNETPMVPIRRVHRFFGNLHVFKGVGLDTALGGVRAALGPPSPDKSILLRCPNRLKEVNTDRMSVEGKLLGYHEGTRGQFYEFPGEVIISQRSCIDIVFQHFSPFPYKTALKNITRVPVRVAKVEKATAKARTLESLERVGLADRADHYPSELSDGQQQRITITRALTMDPEVMFFDESTSALDPELVREVLQAAKGLTASSMTMAVVTREIDFAREATNTVVFMDEGQIVEVGSPAQVIDNPQEEWTRKSFPKVLQPCRYRLLGLFFESAIWAEERRTHFDGLLTALTAQLDEIILEGRRDL